MNNLELTPAEENEQPLIGEIRRGQDIGYKSHNRMLWSACSICGKKRWVVLRHGYYPLKAICANCSRDKRNQNGECGPRWEGGRLKNSQGYIVNKLLPNDFFYPMVWQTRYVFEHRLVMAKHLNRCLLPWEIVHHKNGIRDDNRLENLELLPGAYKHNGITHMKTYIKRLERESQQLRELVAELREQVRLLK